MDTFWSDAPDEHQLRREREAGEAATRKQKTRDGHETFRIQAMKERPFCQNCGRHYAWCQYHDKRYCMTCAPCEVEPIQPPGYLDPTTKRRNAICGYCKTIYSHTEAESRRFCTDSCEKAYYASLERKRKQRIEMLAADASETEKQIVALYVDERLNLREIGSRLNLSTYQVSSALDRQGVPRRSRAEVARMYRMKNEQ